MNTFEKLRKTCKPVRIVLGIAAIVTAVVTENPWFYLGFAPLIAGLVNFCPVCMVTKKCSI